MPVKNPAHIEHTDIVEKNFGKQAKAYLNSTIHAQGEDLKWLGNWLKDLPHARLLDLGCGSGHASYAAAKHVKEVVAYDLSSSMLEIVKKTASERGLANIQTQLGIAESLPFDNASFDVVISRMSAHHWVNVSQSMHEVNRVLMPKGKCVFIDIVSTGYPMLDIYLQTVEVLRDTSHIQDYSPAQWLNFFNLAGLGIRSMHMLRIPIHYPGWIERMETPGHFATAIRALQKCVSTDVSNYFEIKDDGSFTLDLMILEGEKI